MSLVLKKQAYKQVRMSIVLCMLCTVESELTLKVILHSYRLAGIDRVVIAIDEKSNYQKIVDIFYDMFESITIVETIWSGNFCLERNRLLDLCSVDDIIIFPDDSWKLVCESITPFIDKIAILKIRTSEGGFGKGWTWTDRIFTNNKRFIYPIHEKLRGDLPFISEVAFEDVYRNHKRTYQRIDSDISWLESDPSIPNQQKLIVKYKYHKDEYAKHFSTSKSF